MDMTIRAMTPDEKKYSYTTDAETLRATGCIGHLRGDMDRDGDGFFTSWDDHTPEKNDAAFKSEFDAVINTLRFDEDYGGLLKSRGSLAAYAYSHPVCSYVDGRGTFGVRADTAGHAYLLRCDPNPGVYNFYVYCYERAALDRQLAADRAALDGLRSAPLYLHTGEYARAHGELEQYRASDRAGIACKEAIETAISAHYYDNRLHDGAVKEVVDRFGWERTLCVLADTVRHKDWDGRISNANKAWAQTVPVPENDANDRVSRFVVDRPHTGLTDLFITQARHDFLLTQPLTQDEIRAEAAHLLKKLQEHAEPNSPAGTHYMARVTPDFLERATSKDLDSLKGQLPFRSLSLAGAKGRAGTFAFIGKDENRAQELRPARTSVRDGLKAPCRAGEGKRHSREAER